MSSKPELCAQPILVISLLFDLLKIPKIILIILYVVISCGYTLLFLLVLPILLFVVLIRHNSCFCLSNGENRDFISLKYLPKHV